MRSTRATRDARANSRDATAMDGADAMVMSRWGTWARVPLPRDGRARVSGGARAEGKTHARVKTDRDADVSRAIDSKKKVSTFVIDCAKPVCIKP